ncbi:MAG: hypothetical protein ACRYFZ_12000 [Janthinobacterium lividum]
MVYLAQPLILTLQQCPPTGVYLRWLSPLGTWEGWLFAGDVDTKTDIADATDIATADARSQVAVRRAGFDTLTVRAGDLSTAQHQALNTILDSPQVYQQFADGTRQPVIVSANASAPRTSSDGRHQLELEIKLPARNALTH